MKYYTGIGSRKTPKDICKRMTIFAARLEFRGYILRSGSANGADSAFESGVHGLANKEIYLPWKNFNNSSSDLYGICEQATEIAQKFHPNWKACSVVAKKLHSRNVYQILGKDLKTPSKFVICWTADGKDSGGTGLAIRIAESLNIPIFNLYYKTFDQSLEKLVSNND